MLERAARGWAAAPPWVENLLMGSHPREGRARRGRPVGRPWGVGRGAQIPLREHRRSAPRVLTVPKRMTERMLVGRRRAPKRIALKLRAPEEASIANSTA